MFEKEAEEYREEWQSKGYYFVSQEMEQIELDDIVDATFKDGAEFGYNKANEWHYVKDGDLPKETGLLMSKTLLLVIKMKGSDCLSLALGEYNFSTQKFSYQHIVGLTDVIAWKEIVLPELKESEKK
jgi:hypothetical protein